MKTNKQNKKHIAAGLALTLLVSGTFAWQSFSQEATNEIIESVGMPGGRLHDYFNGNDKDVFVENYGGADAPDVYARVRIAEYLEFGKDAGSLSASGSSMTVVRGDIENTSTPSITEPDTWDIYDYTATTPSDIRTYRTLDLGGSSVYMPTFNQDNTDKDPDVRGTYRDKNGDVKETPYDDYEVFKVATDSEPASTETGDVTTVDGTTSGTHTAAATADATVMTMDAWLAAGAPVQDTWVFDENGWAYYAAPIKPGTASGLLIDGIKNVENPKEEWYYAVDVTAQLATAGDWGSAPSDAGEDGTGMYEDMSDEALYLLNKAAGLVTVENMTITNNGTALTATDAILSTTAITFDVDMDVINGSTNSDAQAAELAISWSIAEENVASISTALDNTLSVDTENNQATFTATQAMVDSGNRYIITATSTLDPSKSVKITMHDGSALEVPEVEDETPDETPTEPEVEDEFLSSGSSASGTITGTALSAINGATALDPTSTVTIDGVEWYVLAKGTKTNEEGDEFTGAFLYMKEPLKVDGEYAGFVFQDVAEDGYDITSWKMSDLRGTLAGKLADYPTLAAAAQSVDTTVNGYTLGTPETTYDKFFPLSEAEFTTTYELGSTNLAIAKDTAGTVGGSSIRWLRSASDSTLVRSVHCSYGTFYGTSATITRGVRPALWVSL